MNTTNEVLPVITQLMAIGQATHSDSIFPREPVGYAASVAVSEILSSWHDALKDGSSDNLLGDVDRTINLLVSFRNRAADILPAVNTVTAGDPKPVRAIVAVTGNTDPYAALSEIRDSLAGLGLPVSRDNIDSDYVTRANYFVEVALGYRQLFDEIDYANPAILGKRIRYTAHNNGDPLSVGIVEGVLAVVESTSGGNFRLSIRTDRPAAQGGGNLTPRVYSHEGLVELIDDVPASTLSRPA
ncbi:hypothetical protein [Paraburkholderia sp. SIMBA_054]|uniref:hypothetical protein n=1 Tax=Paraburkholderia sp. SIMBA_054 TaxID=3085795 RepID=UPI00397A63E5